jgi:hypothetical protein
MELLRKMKMALMEHNVSADHVAAALALTVDPPMGGPPPLAWLDENDFEEWKGLIEERDECIKQLKRAVGTAAIDSTEVEAACEIIIACHWLADPEAAQWRGQIEERMSILRAVQAALSDSVLASQLDTGIEALESVYSDPNSMALGGAGSAGTGWLAEGAEWHETLSGRVQLMGELRNAATASCVPTETILKAQEDCRVAHWLQETAGWANLISERADIIGIVRDNVIENKAVAPGQVEVALNHVERSMDWLAEAPTWKAVLMRRLKEMETVKAALGEVKVTPGMVENAIPVMENIEPWFSDAHSWNAQLQERLKNLLAIRSAAADNTCVDSSVVEAASELEWSLAWLEDELEWKPRLRERMTKIKTLKGAVSRDTTMTSAMVDQALVVVEECKDWLAEAGRWRTVLQRRKAAIELLQRAVERENVPPAVVIKAASELESACSWLSDAVGWKATIGRRHHVVTQLKRAIVGTNVLSTAVETANKLVDESLTWLEGAAVFKKEVQRRLQLIKYARAGVATSNVTAASVEAARVAIKYLSWLSEHSEWEPTINKRAAVITSIHDTVREAEHSQSQAGSSEGAKGEAKAGMGEAKQQLQRLVQANRIWLSVSPTGVINAGTPSPLEPWMAQSAGDVSGLVQEYKIGPDGNLVLCEKSDSSFTNFYGEDNSIGGDPFAMDDWGVPEANGGVDRFGSINPAHLGAGGVNHRAGEFNLNMTAHGGQGPNGLPNQIGVGMGMGMGSPVGLNQMGEFADRMAGRRMTAQMATAMPFDMSLDPFGSPDAARASPSKSPFAEESTIAEEEDEVQDDAAIQFGEYLEVLRDLVAQAHPSSANREKLTMAQLRRGLQHEDHLRALSRLSPSLNEQQFLESVSEVHQRAAVARATVVETVQTIRVAEGELMQCNARAKAPAVPRYDITLGSGSLGLLWAQNTRAAGTSRWDKGCSATVEMVSGQALKTGKVGEGDILLTVNNKSTEAMSYGDTLKLVQSAPRPLTLVLESYEEEKKCTRKAEAEASVAAAEVQRLKAAKVDAEQQVANAMDAAKAQEPELAAEREKVLAKWEAEQADAESMRLADNAHEMGLTAIRQKQSAAELAMQASRHIVELQAAFKASEISLAKAVTMAEEACAEAESAETEKMQAAIKSKWRKTALTTEELQEQSRIEGRVAAANEAAEGAMAQQADGQELHKTNSAELSKMEGEYKARYEKSRDDAHFHIDEAHKAKAVAKQKGRELTTVLPDKLSVNFAWHPDLVVVSDPHAGHANLSDFDMHDKDGDGVLSKSEALELAARLDKASRAKLAIAEQQQTQAQEEQSKVHEADLAERERLHREDVAKHKAELEALGIEKARAEAAVEDAQRRVHEQEEEALAKQEVLHMKKDKELKKKADELEEVEARHQEELAKAEQSKEEIAARYAAEAKQAEAERKLADVENRHKEEKEREALMEQERAERAKLTQKQREEVSEHERTHSCNDRPTNSHQLELLFEYYITRITNRTTFPIIPQTKSYNRTKTIQPVDVSNACCVIRLPCYSLCSLLSYSLSAIHRSMRLQTNLTKKLHSPTHWLPPMLPLLMHVLPAFSTNLILSR